jgi:hypothetical protein
MRAALSDVSRNLIAVADQIDRLEIVREINRPPASARVGAL